ncbi:hypothetical protein HZB88_00395 [archaeon]|nr:hypothetical protein [archaeon]
MIKLKQASFILIILFFVFALLNGCVSPPTPPVCGDGVCEQGENHNNCPSENGGDCPPISLCGNGICDINAGENTTNCSNDCPPITLTGCEDTNYSMAFILVANNRSEITSDLVNNLNAIRNAFPNTFYTGTYGLATMNTNYSIVTYSKDELSGIDYGNQKVYPLESIVNDFYKTNPDNFDFITIFATQDFSPEQTEHKIFQNRIVGLGSPPLGGMFNRVLVPDLNVKRLLGISFYAYPNIIQQSTPDLHELGHQWCCYLGDNFVPDNNNLNLGIIQDGIHYYMGLDAPMGAREPMGAHYWLPNGDGSYRVGDKGSTEPQKYHPFTLYLMGLYDENNFDFNENFTIYYAPSDMQNAAWPVKKININDIIAADGRRMCIPN